MATIKLQLFKNTFNLYNQHTLYAIIFASNCLFKLNCLINTTERFSAHRGGTCRDFHPIHPTFYNILLEVRGAVCISDAVFHTAGRISQIVHQNFLTLDLLEFVRPNL